VRCEVILADVRLEVDDPRDPRPAGPVAVGLPDEKGAEQPFSGLEGRPGEELAKVAQLVATWKALSDSGTSSPNTP
jgi:hypothetical protein